MPILNIPEFYPHHVHVLMRFMRSSQQTMIISLYNINDWCWQWRRSAYFKVRN